MPEHDHATADLIQFLSFPSVSTDPPARDTVASAPTGS